MRREVVRAWFACFVLCLPSFAYQDRPAPVPKSSAEWQQAGSKPLAIEALAQYGSQTNIDREYGVKSAELRTYALGGQSLQVAVEHAPDSVAAYGLFTFYRTAKTQPVSGVELAVEGPQYALMVRGKDVFRILKTSPRTLASSVLKSLLMQMGGAKLSAQAIADLPTPLPPEKLLPASEKYILGPLAAKAEIPLIPTDALGFDRGAEVHMGEYELGGDHEQLLAISYPTPMIARQRYVELEHTLNFYKGENKQTAYGRRDGSFVFLVLGGGRESAKTLLDKFKVTQDVSWNVPYPGSKPVTQQLLEFVLGNIFLSMLIASFGLIGGVGIALSRRIAARWFPAAKWGHPDEGNFVSLNIKD
jgi:Family of unknown function (DUF6599)